MAGPTPIVRQLIVCDRVSYSFDAGYTLTNPRVGLVPEPGEDFPLARPVLSVFAQVVGSYGRHLFRLRLADVTDPTAPPEVVFEDRPRAIDFGPPLGPLRLRARGWSVRLSGVEFVGPGRYELSMAFEGGQAVGVELLVEDRT